MSSNLEELTVREDRLVLQHRDEWYAILFETKEMLGPFTSSDEARRVSLLPRSDAVPVGVGFIVAPAGTTTTK
jgi:hypothetical protein